MSSNNSTSSSGSAGGGSTHRPSNLSLAERIRLSHEREERERRRQAQEDLHRLQEQSSHAARGSGEEYTMPLNDASVDEARGRLEPEGSAAPQLEPEGVLAPANTTSRRLSSRSSSLISEVDESDQDESQQQQQPLRGPLTAGASGSVFSYAPSLVSGAMSAVTGTFSAMTGYTGGDEDNDSDSREDEMDQSLAVSRVFSAGAPTAGNDNDGDNQDGGDGGDRDDDGNSLTSYEKNVALHTAVQLGALTAEAGNDDMSEVASTYDVGSLSGYESAVPSVAGGRSTAGIGTGAMSRRSMGTVSIGGLETIGEEDSQTLLAAEEGMSRQNSGRRSSISGSSGAASSSRRGSALQAAAGGIAMAGPGLLDRVANSYSRSSGSSRGRWSTTDDEYTAAYTSASDTTDYSYSNPSDSSRSFYSNPRFGFRNYNGASDRSFYTSSTSESGESTGDASRPSLLDAVSEKLSQSFRTISTRSVSESSTSHWGSNSDLLIGSQKIPTKTGKRIRQADMMVRRRWAIPASIVLAVLLFLAIYLGLQSRKSGNATGLELSDGGGRGGDIYGDDDAVMFEGGDIGLYPTASPAEIVSQVPTSEVMIHTVPSLLDDNYELGSEVGLSTTTTTTEVATGWGVQAGQPTPDPALLPSLAQGADGTWGFQAGEPTIDLDSSLFENIQSETKTTTTTTTTTTDDGGGFTTDTDVTLKWKVPAGSPTPNPALLSQVTSLSVTGSDGTDGTGTKTEESVSLLWKIPEGSPTPDPALLVDMVNVAAPVAVPTPAVQTTTTTSTEAGTDTRPVEIADFSYDTTTNTEDASFVQVSDTTSSTTETTTNYLPTETTGAVPPPPAPAPAPAPVPPPPATAPLPAPGPAPGGPVVTTQPLSPEAGGYPVPPPPEGYPQYAPNYGGYGMYPGGYPQMPMYPQYPQYAPVVPTQPVAAATTPVAVATTDVGVVMHHNTEFIGDCLEKACIADENEEYFKGHSHEDNAIYEIFYTNPVKCCGVVMEIGAGDGLDGSVSNFFEQGLNWKSILVEANPDKFKELKMNRPDATAINAGFCESGSMKFDGEFHPKDPDEIISEAVSMKPLSEEASEDVMCLSMSPLIRQNLKVTHIDVMVIHVDGDPLAVIRKMDWTVRVDIWIIVMNEKTEEMEERNKVVKSVLDRNEYVEADWDIKRWCDESNKGHCENNTVFLRKNFNPLYLQRSLKGKKQLRGNSK